MVWQNFFDIICSHDLGDFQLSCLFPTRTSLARSYVEFTEIGVRRGLVWSPDHHYYSHRVVGVLWLFVLDRSPSSGRQQQTSHQFIIILE
jgi:hypothetical protein